MFNEERFLLNAVNLTAKPCQAECVSTYCLPGGWRRRHRHTCGVCRRRRAEVCYRKQREPKRRAFSGRAAEFKRGADCSGKRVAGKITDMAIPLFGRFWFFCRDSGDIAGRTAISIGQARLAGQYPTASAQRRQWRGAHAIAVATLPPKNIRRETAIFTFSLANFSELLTCLAGRTRNLNTGKIFGGI